MQEQISWHIGNDEENGRLDTAALKSYFYWKQNGRMFKSAQLTKEEEQTEIERLRSMHVDTKPFRAALRKL